MAKKSNVVAPALLTVHEVAGYLGLGDARVWQMVAAGQIPSIKVGRARRVVRADLDRFIEELRSGAVDGASLAGPNTRADQEEAK